MKNCILLEAHLDNEYIRQQLTKLVSEVDKDKYDVWLLYNGESCSIDYSNVYLFNEKSVTKLGFKLHRYYPIGNKIFYGNNTELSFLSFYKEHKEYGKYWVIEFDVYCNGNWGDFFEFYDNKREDVDYFGTHIEHLSEKNQDWMWWDYCWSNGFEIKEKVKSFNPLCRLSNKALSDLLDVYSDEKDNYGFFEVYMPTVLYGKGCKLRAFEKDGCSDEEFLDDWTDGHNEWIKGNMFVPWDIDKGKMEENKIYHAIKS